VAFREERVQVTMKVSRVSRLKVNFVNFVINLFEVTMKVSRVSRLKDKYPMVINPTLDHVTMKVSRVSRLKVMVHRSE